MRALNSLWHVNTWVSLFLCTPRWVCVGIAYLAEIHRLYTFGTQGRTDWRRRGGLAGTDDEFDNLVSLNRFACHSCGCYVCRENETGLRLLATSCPCLDVGELFVVCAQTWLGASPWSRVTYHISLLHSASNIQDSYNPSMMRTKQHVFSMTRLQSGL